MIAMNMNRTLSTLAVMLILVAAGISQNDKHLSPALASLVAAERAFAKASVEKGVRASFLEFFADDGIGFSPHPTKIREAYLKRPAPATRPPAVLDWKPVYADVSRAGDIGYTTGPYTFKDLSPEKKPTQYGIYFSIWKKQTDGGWKVELDAGIQTPDHSQLPFAFVPAAPSGFRMPAAQIDLEKEREALANRDREFLSNSIFRGTANAFLDCLAGDARLHRDGVFPIIGLAAIRSYLSAKPMQLKWEPIKSDISRSADLGYTYGSYELRRGDNEVEKGYYVRVWKRNGSGKWKLALDTLSPIPPEAK
jgi:ketosteroid isomerase-like protein